MQNSTNAIPFVRTQADVAELLNSDPIQALIESIAERQYRLRVVSVASLSDALRKHIASETVWAEKDENRCPYPHHALILRVGEGVLSILALSAGEGSLRRLSELMGRINCELEQLRAQLAHLAWSDRLAAVFPVVAAGPSVELDDPAMQAHLTQHDVQPWTREQRMEATP